MLLALIQTGIHQYIQESIFRRLLHIFQEGSLSLSRSLSIVLLEIAKAMNVSLELRVISDFVWRKSVHLTSREYVTFTLFNFVCKYPFDM